MKLKSQDPQLSFVPAKSCSDSSDDDNEGDWDMKVDTNTYMQNLHRYAMSQKEIYESHPVSKDKPLQLNMNETKNVDPASLWLEYTQSLQQLLEKRAELQIESELSTSPKSKSIIFAQDNAYKY